MTESHTSSPTDDLWQAKAANALDRAMITTAVPDGRRGLAVGVVTVLMKAGLPISNLHADAFEDRCGVALSVVPGPGGLQLLWRQHPHMENQGDEVWGAQQSAMHQALRAILAAHGYWLKDQPAGEAPIVMGRARP
ncbi:hypothetical protein AB0G35_34780 [Streptomyces sp. NPDC021749]|uniref:hypothetical protein n=1 Tax=Streptomyces sp. NPDC021749 TaxID=3154905 RepID=UPI0033DB27D6